MPIGMIAVYFCALCLGAGILIYVHRLNRMYLTDFIAFYAIHLSISIPLSVLGKPLPVLIVSTMKLEQLQADQFMILFSLLLAKPLWIFSIYFLAKCIAALVEKKTTRAFTAVYFLFWGIFVLVKLIYTIQFFNLNTISPGFQVFNGINTILEISASLLIFGFGIIQAGKIGSPNRKQGARIFSVIGFLSKAVFWVLIFLYFSFTIPFLIGVAIPIPALLFLSIFLKRAFPADTSLIDSDGSFKKGLTRFNVTPREQEIIAHICSGQSNKDIASSLFISIHTVKRHINQVYHKLGIKNRVQLANLVRGNSNPEIDTP
ncbi:MAG: helix-turn-helix transcriptional regulator [Deltaproteobacteria bacterium]|nr:helix-turn-helix transcriptional regulator [Deltaproteobacteria bacterium]